MGETAVEIGRDADGHRMMVRPLTTDEKIDALYRKVLELEAMLVPTLEKLSSGGIMALMGMGRK